MSNCPFANLLDPDTYAGGMPYSELRKFRDAGPVVHMEDPRTGVPYWVISQQKELDYVCKHPALFSSAERSPFPEEYDDFMIEEVHRKNIIGMDPPVHLKMRRVVRNAFTP